MPRPLAVHVCGLPPPEDGHWHRLGYLSHKCDTCRFVAAYVRQRPGERAEHRCSGCLPPLDRRRMVARP